MTDWAQIFTGFLFYAYVEIHQLWRLVFDNLSIVSTVFNYISDSKNNNSKTTIKPSVSIVHSIYNVFHFNIDYQ